MIKDLDNKEISLVYYSFRDYLKELNKTLDSGYRSKLLDVELPMPGMEDVQPIAIVRVTKEEVAAVRSSHHYLVSQQIVDKLRPIVELIEEAEPNIKKMYEDE